MMKRRKRLQAGVGLLEIVVTMFLVLVGLLVVMTSFLAIARAHRYSERMDTATALACREMERIRNLPWVQIQSEVGIYEEYPDHPDFRHETDVQDNGMLKQVTLRVFFENDRRRAEMTTLVVNL